MTDDPFDNYAETVRFASAYGVDNVHVQEALRSAASIVLDEVRDGVGSFLQGEECEDTFLADMLPPAFAPLYDRRFLNRFDNSSSWAGSWLKPDRIR